MAADHADRLGITSEALPNLTAKRNKSLGIPLGVARPSAAGDEPILDSLCEHKPIERTSGPAAFHPNNTRSPQSFRYCILLIAFLGSHISPFSSRRNWIC